MTSRYRFVDLGVGLLVRPPGTTVPKAAPELRSAELRHPGHSPQSVHAGKHRGVMSDMREPDGGFTVDRDGKPITTGWSVGIEGSTTPIMASEIDTNRPKVRAALVDKMKTVPADADGIGGWHDPKTGIVHIDHVKVFPSSEHDAAKKFAEANNQISMANLDAIAAGDWDNAIEPIGGSGDLGRSRIHDDAEALHVQVLEAPVRDVGRGAGGDRRPDPRSVVERAGRERRRALLGEVRHPGHPDQKVHGKWATGAIDTITGMDSVDAEVQKRIRADVEKTWGMSESEAAALAEANLIAAAERGTPGSERWYHNEHEMISAQALENGITVEQQAGMIAVTSAQKKWVPNKALADGIAKKLKADEPFDLTQADIDDYNAWVGNRKAGLAQPHPGFAPGRYRPSDLPADLAASKTPGMPKHKNTDYVISATEIYRGKPVGEVINGPKQRSFINNLTEPTNGNYVTADTWHYEAMGGSHQFVKTVKGVTYSDTIAGWNTKTSSTPQRSPQDFFQSTPSVKPHNYPGTDGHYPWVVDRTKSAAATYNQSHGTSLSPSEFQALVWDGIGGGQ